MPINLFTSCAIGYTGRKKENMKDKIEKMQKSSCKKIK